MCKDYCSFFWHQDPRPKYLITLFHHKYFVFTVYTVCAPAPAAHLCISVCDSVIISRGKKTRLSSAKDDAFKKKKVPHHVETSLQLISAPSAQTACAQFHKYKKNQLKNSSEIWLNLYIITGNVSLYVKEKTFLISRFGSRFRSGWTLLLPCDNSRYWHLAYGASITFFSFLKLKTNHQITFLKGIFICILYVIKRNIMLKVLVIRQI